MTAPARVCLRINERPGMANGMSGLSYRMVYASSGSMAMLPRIHWRNKFTERWEDNRTRICPQFVCILTLYQKLDVLYILCFLHSSYRITKSRFKSTNRPCWSTATNVRASKTTYKFDGHYPLFSIFISKDCFSPPVFTFYDFKHIFRGFFTAVLQP